MTTHPHQPLPALPASVARLHRPMTAQPNVQKPTVERPKHVPHVEFLTPEGICFNPAPLTLLPDGNGNEVPAYWHSIYLMRYPTTYTTEELALIEEFVARQDVYWRSQAYMALPEEGFLRPVARIGRCPQRPHPRADYPLRWMVYRDEKKDSIGMGYPTLGHMLSQLDMRLVTSDWWTFTPDGSPILFADTKGLPEGNKLPPMTLLAPTEETLLRYLDLLYKT